jgi:hypothetical protein
MATIEKTVTFRNQFFDKNLICFGRVQGEKNFCCKK